MAEWIKRSEWVHGTAYRRVFWYPEHVGSWGFSFDCDENGQLLSPHANYDQCLTGEIDGRKVLDGGIVSYQYQYRIPGIIKCGVCDVELEITAAFTTTCECGAGYNSAGQLLADRSQWGEETGEHWSEIGEGSLDD